MQKRTLLAGKITVVQTGDVTLELRNFHVFRELIVKKMISRVYAPFKPLTTRTGIHPHLKTIYRQSQPSRHISVYNREEIQNRSDALHRFSSSETIRISPISDVIPNDASFTKIKEVDSLHQFDQPFVAEIDNGRILEKSGFCTTSSYDILLDTANSRESRVRGFYRSNIRDSIDLFYKQRRPRSESFTTPDVETAVSLIRNPRPDGTRKDNYSHWLQGYLTRLEGVDCYQQLTGNTPQILIEPNPPSWVLESLELLGYSDHIHFWDPTEELRVNRLVVPSIRRAEEWQGRTGINYKVLSKQACEWLRNKAVSRADIDQSDFSEKVFISRADAGRRRIQNQEEVLDHLQERGFESYELTKLSFPEQVALFAQADEVVGVHGAGLANIMFASDCTVTEIVGGSFKPTYYIMAEILDLEYQLFSGQSIDDPGLSIHHQDVKIDPSLL